MTAQGPISIDVSQSFLLKLKRISTRILLLKLQKIQLSLNNTKVTFHGGLYDFIKDMKMRKISKLLEPNVVSMESTLDTSNSLCNIYDKICPIIPKVFYVRIEETTVSAVRENSVHDFSAKLNLFTLRGEFVANPLPEYKLPCLFTCLELNDFEIDTVQDKLLCLKQFSIELKLEQDIITIYLKLESFQMNYNHKDIYNWINKNFITRTSEILSVRKKTQIDSIYKKDLVKFFNSVVIKGCAELWKVSTIFNLNGSIGSLYITHSKLLLDQYVESRTGLYKNYALNLLLSNRHWSTELMMESLWW